MLKARVGWGRVSSGVVYGLVGLEGFGVLNVDELEAHAAGDSGFGSWGLGAFDPLREGQESGGLLSSSSSSSLMVTFARTSGYTGGLSLTFETPESSSWLCVRWGVSGRPWVSTVDWWPWRASKANRDKPMLEGLMVMVMVRVRVRWVAAV